MSHKLLKLLVTIALLPALSGHADTTRDNKGDAFSSGLGAILPIGLIHDADKDSDHSGGRQASDLSRDNRRIEIRAHIEPLLFLDLDLSRNRITNLTKQENSGDQRLVTHDYGPDRETLVFGDFRAGFRVVSQRRLVFGLGLKRVFEFKSAAANQVLPFSVYAGLLPIVGSESVVVRHVDTLEAARAASAYVKMPESVTDVALWRVGDSMMFSKKGGLMFFGGVSSYGVGVSAVYIAEGNWSIYVEKVSPREIHVKVTESGLTEYGVAAGAAIVSLGISTFENTDDKFSFRIAVDRPEGEDVFRHLLNGDLTLAQEAAYASNGVAQFTDFEKETQSGTYRSFFIGIPFLYNHSWSSGKIERFSHKNLYFKGYTVQAHYGVFQRAKRYSGLFTRRARQQGFYGASYEVANGGEVGGGKFGKYFWEFGDNYSNHWQVRMALKEFVRRTGLRQAIVNIPTRENLDYIGFSAEIHLDSAKTDKLMAAADRLSRDQFVELGVKRAREYTRNLPVQGLTDQSDPFDICADYAWDTEYCERGLEYDTKGAMKQMWQALRDMRKHQNDNLEFTKAYAEFGEGLSETMFSFQAGFALLEEKIPVDFEIKGTHVSVLKIPIVVNQ